MNKKDQTEHGIDALLQRLRARNKHFDLYAEYGKFLFKHVNDLTPQEKQRMTEIEELLKKDQ